MGEDFKQHTVSVVRSFLYPGGGTCEAEEDAKCLLERTVEKGLERVTHFLFFDSYRQHCSLDRSLNPFSGGK